MSSQDLRPTFSRLSNALPSKLAERVIDLKGGGSASSANDPVKEAVRHFVDQEERESLSAVERLRSAIMSNGLAVTGYESCAGAIRAGQADMLIILDSCPTEEREELVKLAVEAKIVIETLAESHVLASYGGAGCLLRYKLPFTS